MVPPIRLAVRLAIQHIAGTLAVCLLLGPVMASEPFLESTLHSLRRADSSRYAEPSEVVGSRVHAGSHLTRLVRSKTSTDELLEYIVSIYFDKRLGEISQGNLPWSTMSIPGWRWESTDSAGVRTVLAIDGPVAIAIRQGRTVEMSIRDLSGGAAVRRGYGGAARYFGHMTSGVVRASAMTEQHLSRKSPELFKYFYYFAGPTRNILGSGALPRASVGF